MSAPIINISSRKSDLALVQTNEIKKIMEDAYPSVKFAIGLSDTVGDQVLDQHLSTLGQNTSQGLFTKSLEDELLAKRTRFAVHSLKDMPTKLPPGLVLAAIGKRENPEDAVIFHPKYNGKVNRLEDLPAGSIIGTSSLRREALVKHLYPGLEIATIRGNIQTRLKKLQEADDFDAIIVAAAGFRRGGLAQHIGQLLPVDVFGYGVGQGSIGIECRDDDDEIKEMLVAAVQHEESAQLCTAERSLLYHIEGGCQISMGVSAYIDKEDILTLNATLLSRDGAQRVFESVSGSRFKASEIGIELGNKFLANPVALKILGPKAEKRALTYGDVEAPGDAAAALK